MAQYYAIERSSEYLEHYGVRGMKWGVRRALSKKGDKRARALHKQYNKAHDYLVRLNKKANIGEQKVQQQKYAKRAGLGLGISAIAPIGSHLARVGVNKSILNSIPEGARKFFDGSPSNTHFSVRVPESHPDYKKFERLSRASDNIRKAQAIASGISIAGLGYGGYSGIKSIASYYRTTPKGHGKAVAKRNAFEKEMKKTFKSTPYSDPSYWPKADYKLNKKFYDRARKKRKKKINYNQKYD